MEHCLPPSHPIPCSLSLLGVIKWTLHFYWRWKNTDEFSASWCKDNHYLITMSHTRLTLQQQVCSDCCCILSKEFHQIAMCKRSIPPLLFPICHYHSIIRFNRSESEVAGNSWWAALSCLSCWLCCCLLKSWMFLGWNHFSRGPDFLGSC